MNTKLTRYINSINDLDPQEAMRKKYLFLQHHLERVELLKSVKTPKEDIEAAKALKYGSKKALKALRKKYSDAVVEFDAAQPVRLF